ncbi:uncharacterized protein LOC125682192 [Ostrea edulis]|uniref:uncharacterized protein LOC125682192 n=1 Tax=Ostrea edulis TaxID=37623 RepID=UPI0024AEC762|nr:uncharacterized protein LOC125682192 [Ostrea edulis]
MNFCEIVLFLTPLLIHGKPAVLRKSTKLLLSEALLNSDGTTGPPLLSSTSLGNRSCDNCNTTTLNACQGCFLENQLNIKNSSHTTNSETSELLTNKKIGIVEPGIVDDPFCAYCQNYENSDDKNLCEKKFCASSIK